MAKRRTNLIDYQQFQIGLKHLFGGHRLFAICFVIFILICLNLSGNVFWVLLTDGFCSLKFVHLAIPFVFAAAIFLTYSLANQAGEAVGNLSVIETAEVSECKVLIAFLSFPGKEDLPLISELIDEKKSRESKYY